MRATILAMRKKPREAPQRSRQDLLSLTLLIIRGMLQFGDNAAAVEKNLWLQTSAGKPPICARAAKAPRDRMARSSLMNQTLGAPAKLNPSSIFVAWTALFCDGNFDMRRSTYRSTSQQKIAKSDALTEKRNYRRARRPGVTAWAYGCWSWR